MLKQSFMEIKNEKHGRVVIDLGMSLVGVHSFHVKFPEAMWLTSVCLFLFHLILNCVIIFLFLCMASLSLRGFAYV